MQRMGRVACALLLFSLAGVSQERVGELKGVATDSTGAVLPDVNVTITNKTTNRVYTTATGQEGAYIVRNLDPGRYSVKFETSGFTTVEYGDVIVVAGKVINANAQMEVGGTQQTVEVVATASLIDTTTTAVGHNVTQEEFSRIPKGRTFQSLANSSPSVLSGEVVEGGIQVNGASGSENQFNVDGLSTNSLIQGQSHQNAAFEILEEVQVKTGGIEAQYGGALGGVISAITRSGGNAFHGDVHYYYYGNALGAGPVKRLFMNPVDLTTVTYQQDHKNQDSTHEAGYSLGGYFIKNRLYFFSAASPQFRSRTSDYLATDFTPVTLTQDARYWQAYNKLSADITRNLRATAGFLWTPSSAQGVIASYNGLGNQVTSSAASILANQRRGYFTPQSNYTLNLDWTITTTSLLSIKAARFWDNYKALGVPNVSAIEWGQPSTDIPGIPAELAQPKGFTTIPRVQTTLFDLATRNLIQADFSKFVRLGGTHDVKVGIGRQKNINKVDNSYPGGGYITLYWNTALALPDGQEARGTYGYYQLDDIGTKGSTGGTIDDIYFQDRWRIGSRLSLDVGLRLEKEVIPSFRRDIKEYAFEFGWGSKIAPRLGASYDLFGDGKVKLYGSWGRFYDWVKYELARGTFGGDVWRTYYRPLDSIDPNVVLKLGNGNLPGNNLWPTTFQDWRIPAFGSGSVDPNIKPMSSWLANAGVEWQLNPSLVVAGRYTHNSLRNTIEDIGTLINGSEVYIYGNPGQGLAQMSSPSTATPSFPLPRAKRVYDAMERSFTRRFAQRWLASGSYVYSRLWGNYAGLQNSDEIAPAGTYRVSAVSQQISGTVYRPGTSASRAYDLDFYSWDSHGNLDVTGRLASDRPHVFKLYGSYTLPSKLGDTEMGGFFFAGSGTPMSTYVQDVQNVPIFVNGRGDMGRTPILSQTDLLVAHEVRITESKRMRFEFNAQNLFNQKTSRYTYNFYNRYRIRSSSINMKNVDLRNGYDYKAMIAATPDASTPAGALDPRFGWADNFNPGFSGRLGVKFMF